MPRRQKPASPTVKLEAASPEAGQPPLPMHEHIGRGLRALFDEVVAQPVPDRFRELLEELAQKHGKK